MDVNNPMTWTSWVEVPADSGFPIQNLPFGIFSTAERTKRVGVAIGDSIVDLKVLHVLGYLENLPFTLEDLDAPVLNRLIARGKPATRELRSRLQKLLRSDRPDLRDREHHASQVLVPLSEAALHLPVDIGDYTDFYSSEDHARNVGKMFRDPENALLPNWKHLPVGYHGRASSIVVSGTPIRRPSGQTRPDPSAPPVFGPTRLLDFELETAFITYPGKPLGEPSPIAEAAMTTPAWRSSRISSSPASPRATCIRGRRVAARPPSPKRMAPKTRVALGEMRLSRPAGTAPAKPMIPEVTPNLALASTRSASLLVSDGSMADFDTP